MIKRLSAGMNHRFVFSTSGMLLHDHGAAVHENSALGEQGAKKCTGTIYLLLRFSCKSLKSVSFVFLRSSGSLDVFCLSQHTGLWELLAAAMWGEAPK